MNISNLLKNRNVRVIIIDLFMLSVLVINLNLIIFDWIFTSAAVKGLLLKHTPGFFHFYNDNIHSDFLIIDLAFVAIYIIELIIRWIIAIAKKTYYKWWFYLFVHWYDVLGCIPVGSMRFLRILRVISILIRLQSLEVIDLTKTFLYDRGSKYLNMIIEEISDRVVVNVLDGIQDEVRKGNPVSDRVITEIIMPHKTSLVEWLSYRLQKISNNAHAKYKEDIQQYVNKRISDAVDENKEIKAIGLIPIFGSAAVGSLEKIISDIVFSVVNGIIEDLASENNKIIVEDVTDITLDTLLLEQESDQRLNEIIKDITVQSIELIKEQVKVKQWKIREMEERNARLKAKMDAEMHGRD